MKDAPSCNESRMVATMPSTRSETKSIIVNPVRIPAPTTSPTIWFGLSADANSPIETVAAAYRINPK